MTHLQTLKEIEKLKIKNKTLKDLNVVKSLLIAPDGVVDIELDLSNIDETDIRKIKLDITKKIKLDLNFSGLRFKENIKREEEKKQDESKKNYKYLAIISGKGGVGKSTICINLANALKRLGYNVGLIDSDIYGASVPDYLGIEKLKVFGGEHEINPILTLDGVEVISARFLLDEKKQLIWRAPMLKNILDYFFKKVNWDRKTNLILIDMPPGTGDVLLDVSEYTKNNISSVLITTPDINASKIALKSGLALKDLGINLLGVIENMSYIKNSNIKPFGEGGGAFCAKSLEKDLLYKMPLYDKNDNKVLEEYDMLAKIVDKKLKED